MEGRDLPEPVKRPGSGKCLLPQNQVSFRYGCEQRKANHSFLLHRRIMAGANIFMMCILFILSWFTVDPDIAKTGLVPILMFNLIVIIFSIYSLTSRILISYVILAALYTIFLIGYIIYFNVAYAGSFPSTFYLVVVGINTGLTATLNVIQIGLAIGMLQKCGWQWKNSQRLALNIDSRIDNFNSEVLRHELTGSTHFTDK